MKHVDRGLDQVPVIVTATATATTTATATATTTVTDSLGNRENSTWSEHHSLRTIPQ